MRLLLIDDEPQIGTVIRRVAESCDYEVEVTMRAAGFKIAFKSRRPDVIVLDLAVPDCDGIELLRFLADAQRQARIIVLSGLERKILEVAKFLGEARGLKMVGAISKPISIAAVRALLDGARQAE